jgi:two-component system CheB/CheR fusion protein
MEIIRIDDQDLILNINNDFLKDIIGSEFMIYTLILKTDGTIIYYNIEHQKYLHENVVGKKISDILSKKEYEEIRKMMLEAMFTSKQILGKIYLNNRYCKILISPIVSEESTIKYLVANFYNITKNKKIEEEIESLKLKLEESNSIKSIFLSNISHELKTPMNAIIGFSDILLEDSQSKEQVDRFLKSINSNAKHLEELLNNILDYSRIESNEFDILYDHFSINELFEELSDIFEDVNYKKNLDFVRLEFIKNSDKKMISDYLRLKQILYNIISNSIKFTDNGYIRVSFNISDNIITFKVEDTGIGIEENKKHLVFDRFWQSDSSSTKKYKGTGLGLSIAKSIVELLNGKIWLESNLGKGTIFYVELPLEEKYEYKIDENINKINFEGKSILIADELPIDFSLVGMYLKSLNINIVSAYNAEQTIKIYKQQKNKIDLIILDLNMLDSDFSNLVNKLRKIKNCKIILKSIHKTHRSDMVDYFLKKPISKENLLSILNEIW